MDPNGASDILEIYFIVYRPDGTTNNNKVLLFDDGKPENGDVIAGDGIYSRLIQVDQSNQKGTYRFEFRAKDRLGDLSNIIKPFCAYSMMKLISSFFLFLFIVEASAQLKPESFNLIGDENYLSKINSLKSRQQQHT